ncbi:MAG: Trm112 family protein [Alphaproteobacteria bacterium]
MSDEDRTMTQNMTQKETGGVDPKLLEILVCPLTKGPLRYDRERQELVSEQAGLAYPIRDGIPIMLVDEARRIEDGGDGAPPP